MTYLLPPLNPLRAFEAAARHLSLKLAAHELHVTPSPAARPPRGAQLIACPPKHQARPADPCALVIFGATGDLTKRLVVPALYNLSRSKALPEQFALIGVARSDGTADSWRERLHDMLKSFVGRACFRW